MKEFVTTVDIAAPAVRVWAVLLDIERWPEWTPSVQRIVRLGSGPLAVGTRALIRQPKLPPALWTVTALDGGRSFTWVSRAPGVRVIGEHVVEGDEATSRATLRLRFEGVLGDVLARLSRRITERYVTLEGQGLKARSEDREYRYRER